MKLTRHYRWGEEKYFKTLSEVKQELERRISQ